MTDIEKALTAQLIATIATAIVVYGGGACILIAGILLLPWLLAKIACGIILVVLVAQVISAYYMVR